MEETHSDNPPASRHRWKGGLIPLLVLIVASTGAGAYLVKRSSSSTAGEAGGAPKSDFTAVQVQVVKPTQGLLERKTAQAGTVMAFRWIDIHAEVFGYLKKQPVDRGSVVKEGDLLVEIDVPNLKAQLEQQKAAWNLAKARVKQMEAAVTSAEADLEAVQARIKAAKAKVAQDKAYLTFRKKQAERFHELFKLRSIDERLVDEQEDRLDAAFDAVTASEEAVNAALAQEKASAAKIDQAKADLKEAQEKVKVARAQRDNAQVMVDFATIKAPFDGVITRRSFHVGDFIRAADGNPAKPLLTLQHPYTMRMVVPIPDRDVPYCKPGDPAVVEFDALPHQVFRYPVSRIAASEDVETKTMRVEIDIPNTKNDPSKGMIRQGMYGLATITLARRENALSIPSACLVGKAEGNKAWVWVVRDGKAHRTPIEAGMDDGVHVEVVKGLTADEEVVLTYSGAIGDGVAVQATSAPKSATQAPTTK